jgi:hypothetical protein
VEKVQATTELLYSRFSEPSKKQCDSRRCGFRGREAPTSRGVCRIEWCGGKDVREYERSYLEAKVKVKATTPTQEITEKYADVPSITETAFPFM